MPIVKPQSLKSLKTIELQPDKMSSKIQLIIAMDIAGYTGNHIAEAVGLTANRVSIIRNSPLYLEERQKKWTELQAQVVTKCSDNISAGDPVEQLLKSKALDAVNKQISLMTSGESEFVQKACADSILDRAGYKPRSDKTTVSVEITEKMADRFERVLTRGSEGATIRTRVVEEHGS
jgi:hypothetical protein